MNKKAKILAVDDEVFNLDILTIHLEEAGYDVVGAEDGAIALKKLEEHPDIDVIVLDRMMPNMDGMTMMKHVKDHPQWHDIPVIMQTAAANSKQILEGIQAGVYYYLAKPYNEEVLLSIVRSALRDQSSRHEIQEEMQKQKRTLGLLEQARFRFRTVEESNNLTYLIASCFPKPEDAVYGLHELMMNAIEHGNLGITYKQKSDLIMRGELHDEIAKRLESAEYKDRYATIEYHATDTEIVITIKDQGVGFNWKEYLDFSADRATDPNGRGIAITRSKAFPNLEYRGCGNEVVCRVVRA